MPSISTSLGSHGVIHNTVNRRMNPLTSVTPKFSSPSRRLKRSISVPPNMTSLLRVTLLVILVAIAWRVLSNLLLAPPPGQCAGHVHPAFQEVKDVFCQNVASGKEQGGSFAVYRQGELLINLWGGYADPDAFKHWREDTVSQVWSCTKGVASVAVAMLVDSGLLSYDKPVFTYWPEFAANGKDNITVAMLLSHQAGLVGLGRQLKLQEYRDNWPEVEQLLAQQAPAWAPGTRYSYHAFTHGMYTDALVRKVDPKHRNMSQFFREEIAIPFDLDFYIGLPMEQHFRSTRARYSTVNELFVSKFVMQPRMWGWIPEACFGTILHSSMFVFDFMNDMNVMNDAELQSVGLPSAHGFGSASALARLYDYLANDGTIKGKKLLSSQQVRALSTPVTQNIPVIVTPDQDFAMGTGLEKNPFGQTIFGHRGYGGQNAYADPTHGLGVSYITNFNSVFGETNDPRAADLLQALYKSLPKYHALPGDQK